MNRDKGVVALLAAILANILWGSTFMASKVVLAQCPPVTAVLVRFAIALVIFVIVSFIRKNDFELPVLKARMNSILGLGFLGYTGLYILQMTALKHITSSQSAAIMLLAPVFTLVSESIQSKRFRFREAVVTLTALVGAAAIVADQYVIDLSTVAMQGLFLTLGASVCLGISVVQTKRLLAPVNQVPGFSVYNLTFYALVIGAAGLIPFVILEQINIGGRLPLTADFWIWSFYLGALCSVGAFLMWNWSIKYVSPVGVAATMYLKTPVALGLGAILVGEHLTLIFYAGTFLILGTLFSNQLVAVRGKR